MLGMAIRKQVSHPPPQCTRASTEDTIGTSATASVRPQSWACRTANQEREGRRDESTGRSKDGPGERHSCCVSRDRLASRQTGEEGLLIPGVQKQVLNRGTRCPFAVEKDDQGGIVEIHSARRLLQRVERGDQKQGWKMGGFHKENQHEEWKP